jgi:hypothetical protein
MLRVSATQDRSDPNGWCRLRIEGLGLTQARPIELYIRRGGERRPYLAEEGWQQDLSWLGFTDTRLEGDALVVRIGPAQTWYLSDVATVEIGVRDPSLPDAEPERARLAWPKIILDAKTRPVSAPAVEPAPAEPVVETPLTAGTPIAPPPAPARRTLWPWLAVGVVVLAGLLLAAAYVQHWPPFKEPQMAAATPGPPPAAAPSAPATAPSSSAARVFNEDEVRRFLATNPTPPAADTEAKAYLEAGHPDFALLIFRYAERKGDGSAAMAIGRMYDPTTYSKATSPFDSANADQAATYYEQAAKAGDVEAQFLLGRLMAKGMTSEPDSVERGVVWLQRAQQGGNNEAGKLLAQIKGSGN